VQVQSSLKINIFSFNIAWELWSDDNRYKNTFYNTQDNTVINNIRTNIIKNLYDEIINKTNRILEDKNS
jgi:hypothetical protein